MARAHLIAILLAAACGGGARTTNAMISASSPLSSLGAPHVGVMVSNLGGLHRIWLDSGRTELIETAPDAIPISDTTYILVADGQYVIHRGRERVIVDGVRPNPHGGVAVSKDGRRFAVEQDGAEIAIVSIADATVQRVPVPPGTAITGSGARLSFTWSRDGASLLVLHDGDRFRLDLATGARTPLDALDWKVNETQEPTECPARGLRLERRWARGQQQIALVPLAGANDPEHVASIAERVLVSATNYPDPWTGDGAINMGKKRPDVLVLASFTPACDYFVFALEGRVYLGSVATGRFAFLMYGNPVWLPASPLPGTP